MQSTVGQRGFTLVELAVTVAVLAIIAAIAIPNFRSLINSNRLTSAANEASALVQSARIEALRRNTIVLVCATDAPQAAAPTCRTTGASGIVSYTPNGQVLNRVSFPPQVQARVSPGFGTRIGFRPDGFARATTGAMLTAMVSVCIPTTAPGDNVRLLSIGSGSRVTLSRATGAGGCPQPRDTL